jgi:hypothetical protein
MSLSSTYPNTLTLPNGVLINYNEVPVPNTSYSKIVLEDGTVAVLLHGDYGGGWSTGNCPAKYKQQFILDSRIVLYVLSAEFKTHFDQRDCSSNEVINVYNNFMISIIPDVNDFLRPDDAETFGKLVVRFVPENTIFRINQYDGLERIEIFDLKNYVSS